MTKDLSLEQLQALNRLMFEELGEHAEEYLKTLAAWKAAPNEDLRAKLEAQAIGLRIHIEAMEPGLEQETDLLPED